MEMLKQTGVSAAEPAIAAMQAPALQQKKDERGLLLVGLFKLSKAVFFGAVGAGALNLIHKNVGELAMQIIGGHQLRQGALLSFLYAGLCVVEGTGLMLKKGWAEYFTVVLTAGAMPVETYELWQKFEWFKVGLLLINVVVLVYLLWVLKRKRVREVGA